MCEFISAIKDKEDYFYLTKQDLKGKKFNEYKKFNVNWKEDIKGHGAIEYIYPELKGRGEHWECTNFSSPKNFPECIVDDIKKGNFEGIGICFDILNEKGRAEYNKIVQPAWAEYDKIVQPALAEYNKIVQPALAEYNKIVQHAFWKIAKQKKYRTKEWR